MMLPTGTLLLVPFLSGTFPLASGGTVSPRDTAISAGTPGIGPGNPAPMAISREGPEIWASHNEIDDCEMQQAIECLHEQVCARRNVPYHGKIRCTIGTAVAYLCNYRPKTRKGSKLSKEEKKAGVQPGSLSCDQSEMYEAWRQIRIAKASQTGWWYDKWGFRTYGFDRRCPDGECDNGWKEGNEGEQCSNIDNKHEPLPWTFDFSAEMYPNYTAKYAQNLPMPGDDLEPQYFSPWKEGKRPL